MSREKPILFMDAMVAAILDGRKTVTRRVGKTWATVQPGTRLWVREAWAPTHPDHPKVRVSYRTDATSYGRYQDADGWRCAFPEPLGIKVPFPPAWRPSIHMPRWACRLELEVVSVTVEQDPPVDGESMRQVDDDEARREGFADRAGFMAAWTAMHPKFVGPVYRIEFRRTP